MMSQGESGMLVVKWITDELPPLSWNIIAMKMLSKFVLYEIRPSQISSTTQFPPEIMVEIRKLVHELYGKELPQNISSNE